MNTVKAEYLSVKQVIEKYNFLSAGTLANMRCRKEGPKYYKLNKKVLYKDSELQNWFEQEPVLTKDSMAGRV